MQEFKSAILTHGGTSSDPQESDGPQSAGKVGMDLMDKGKTALDAVVHAVRILEDDVRFNAGTGSQIRADGNRIQLDASCMTSEGKFGAVACVEGVKNPIDLAQGILHHSTHFLIAGDGARIFAEEQNIRIMPISHSDKEKTKNNGKTSSCDTVGAVAFDGTTFAAALSSGGLTKQPSEELGTYPYLAVAYFAARQDPLPVPEMVNLLL